MSLYIYIKDENGPFSTGIRGSIKECNIGTTSNNKSDSKGLWNVIPLNRAEGMIPTGETFEAYNKQAR